MAAQIRSAASGVQLSCSNPDLQVDSRNLVYRAAAAFLDVAKVRDGIRLHLDKRIPPPDSVLHYIMDNLSAHYHKDFCRTVAELSGVPYVPLKTGAERRQWLQSPPNRIVVHFVPFHASWLNMVEIWFGILKKKCLNYDHFTSVATLRETIRTFIDTWKVISTPIPLPGSYTRRGVARKSRSSFLPVALYRDFSDGLQVPDPSASSHEQHLRELSWTHTRGRLASADRNPAV